MNPKKSLFSGKVELILRFIMVQSISKPVHWRYQNFEKKIKYSSLSGAESKTAPPVYFGSVHVNVNKILRKKLNTIITRR